MSDLTFADEDGGAGARERPPWTLLIVDDEAEVHSVTTLALEEFRFAGRGLRFEHAYSGAEARKILAERDDIAVCLLDVVMESDRAGLDVVEHVRNELKNKFLRIILRTGQPGQAPELEVITRYDINDYKHKTELTRERLYTTVYTALSTFRDLTALEANRRGLRKVIDATAELFTVDSMDHLAQGVLEQLTALLFLDQDAVVLHSSGFTAERAEDTLRVVAATGAFSSSVGKDARGALPEDVLAHLEEARQQGGPVVGPDYFITSDMTDGCGKWLFYVHADAPLEEPDQALLNAFCRNVALARDLLGKRG